MNRIAAAALSVAAALSMLSLARPAHATVVVSGPNDGSAFFPLFQPTGEFDERGLSGFEFFISSTTGQFNSNDQYLIQGEDTNELQTIANDLGTVGDLSGVPFDFSIQHNLAGGRNFTFSLTNTVTSEVSVLCWGQNCAPGSNSAELINGFAPINDYNGLQVQVRAQEVAGSSVTVEILGLSGVTLSGEPLFDETVTPSSPGTIFSFDAGRRGQWFMADDNDLTENEWELFGSVMLDRTDSALSDRTKVRLAVDFVRNPDLPFVPVCDDGIDQDGDGHIDWNGGPEGEPADPGCDDWNDPFETSDALPCDDGIDNDGDGRIDFAPVTFADPGDQYTLPSGPGDPGCKEPSWFSEEPRCQDGTDNDSDGAMDYDAGLSRNGSVHPAGPDSQCVGEPWKNKEGTGCGLGAELALLLAPVVWLYRRRNHRL